MYNLEDDIQMVYEALKGSSHPDYPEPKEGDCRYPAFQAFQRIHNELIVLKGSQYFEK